MLQLKVILWTNFETLQHCWREGNHAHLGEQCYHLPNLRPQYLTRRLGKITFSIHLHYQRLQLASCDTDSNWTNSSSMLYHESPYPPPPAEAALSITGSQTVCSFQASAKGLPSEPGITGHCSLKSFQAQTPSFVSNLSMTSMKDTINLVFISSRRHGIWVFTSKKPNLVRIKLEPQSISDWQLRFIK